MIHLHTGCRYSEHWDNAFQKTLKAWNIPYKLCNLLDAQPESGDIFIGRLNESCRDLKHNYTSLVSKFRKAWPEPLAMHLYDDKVAQAVFLKDYPTPRQEYVSNADEVTIPFPAVQKRPDGSSSKHVRIANDITEVEFPCLLQEFCYGNDSDYRINVVGNCVAGFRRMNRPNDFRASGSGLCIALDDLPREPVEIAWDICERHGFTTMAFDFLRLRGCWVIAEMSYTYALQNVMDCHFYLDMVRKQRIADHPQPDALILSKFVQIKYL